LTPQGHVGWLDGGNRTPCHGAGRRAWRTLGIRESRTDPPRETPMGRAIAFKLGDYGPLVRAFLKANPVLPPRGLKVDDVDVMSGKSFIDLLNGVIKTKATELVLVVHGYTDGSGLFMQLAPGAATCSGANLRILNELESSGKDATDRQLANLGLDDQKAVKELIDLMHKVRAMNLSHVEWRSCDLGKQPGVLKQFRIFFGAALMGAPMTENIFGISTVSVRPFDKIPEKFQHDYVPFYYPDKQNTKVINYLLLDNSRWPTEGVMFAERQKDLDDWVHTHINPKGTIKESVAVHALWKDPDESHALDNPTAILPLDPDYAKLIAYDRGP
jgi:hypothetical protein